MFKASDPTFQNDAETLFNLPKKAVIVSVDETGKKVINGNHKDTNWTYEEAQKKIVNKYSKTLCNPQIKYMVDLTDSGFICIDIDAKQINGETDYFNELKNEFPVFDYCMWSKGTTKGLHCFFKLNEAHQFMKRIKKMIRINIKYEVDLITSHMLMSPHENLHGMLGEYENAELEQIFTDKPFPVPKKNNTNNSIPTNVADTDEDALSVFMNNIMGADYGNWSYDKEHFRFKSSSNRCCVEPNHVHSTQDHSCIYFNDGKYLQATCVGTHGTKKIKLHPNKAYQLRQICGIKNADDYAMEMGKNALFELIEQMCEETGLKDYKETKAEFEKEHALIRNSAAFLSISCPDGDDPDAVGYLPYLIRNKNDFLTITENCMYIGENDNGTKAIKKSFAKEWLRDTERKEYNRLDCCPNLEKCPKKVFNTWKPYLMENVTDYIPNDEALIDLKKIIRALVSDNEEQAVYFEKWIAHAIKFPDKKSGICPVFISKEGCGKGTLLKYLKKMLGNQKVFETESPELHVWGQFNAIIEDAKIIVLDEVGQTETAKKSKFKNLITEPTITINQKNVKSYEKSFYGEFILTTNEDNPIKFGKDNRRFVVLQGDERYKNNITWWNRNDAHLEDEAKMKTCYEYFKNMDITEKTMFNLPKPISEYEKDIIEANRSPVDMFQDELLTINEPVLDLKKSTLFERYTEFEKGLKLDYNIPRQKFSLQFKNLKLSWAREKMIRGTRYWVLDLNAGRKEKGITDVADDEPAVDSDFSFD